MCRAVRAIHRIIQVSRPAATSDSVPPMASCASNVRPFGPNVRTAPVTSAMPIAVATPAHSAGTRSRRAERTR
ncbi:hypothetical protein CHMI_03577 [Cellulomonas hominis]|nr:hypothetical protein CHMI_03577 [Cellulomonas hominis]